MSCVHQDVGCDHKIGSGAKEDICGVCEGNGTTCRTVEGRFNQLAGSGTLETDVKLLSQNRIVDKYSVRIMVVRFFLS